MWIMMVAARYLPLMGGIETHIHEVSMRMAALGHEVTVLTTDPSGAFLPHERMDGVDIIRVKAWPKNRDYYFAPSIYTEIARSQECDIIHVQGYSTLVAPIAMAAAIRHKIPFVLTFHSGGHSSPARNAVRGIQRAVLSPLVNRASRLIGVSEFEADLFSDKMGIERTRFIVVPNGASLPPPSDPPPAKERHLVLSVGRLERYKGHHRVIQAMPELLRRVPDARLKIVGSGPYERDLRKMVASHGLGDIVTFVSIPSTERSRLTDLFCSAGLVVLLSDYEAHPVAVMEALSVHCRVLVTDTSGLREIAQKGLCRSIPLDSSPGRIAAAIAGEFGRARIQLDTSSKQVDLPDWDDCTQQILKEYSRIMAWRSI